MCFKRTLELKSQMTRKVLTTILQTTQQQRQLRFHSLSWRILGPARRGFISIFAYLSTIDAAFRHEGVRTREDIGIADN